MTGYNHVAIGVIVGVSIKNPIAVIPVAFASHFVLDALPHFGNNKKFDKWNTNFIYLLAIDAALCLSVLLFAIYKWPNLWLPIGLGAFFAALPDFIWLAYGKKKLPDNWFFRFSKWVQWGEFPWGMVIEIPVFVCLMIVIIGGLH